MRTIQRPLEGMTEIYRPTELERLAPESFEPFVVQHVGSTIRLEGSEDIYIEYAGISHIGLDSMRPSTFDGAPEGSFSAGFGFDNDAGKLEAYTGADLDHPGFVLSDHRYVLQCLESFSASVDTHGVLPTRGLDGTIVATRAILDQRMKSAAGSLAQSLDFKLKLNADMFHPWVIAWSADSRSGIAARIVGFKSTEKVRNMPVVEPIVASFFGKEVGLLPSGYSVHEDWLRFSQNELIEFSRP